MSHDPSRIGIYILYRELEPAMKRRQGMLFFNNLWYLLKIYTHLLVDSAYSMSLQVKPNEWKWSGMGKADFGKKLL